MILYVILGAVAAAILGVLIYRISGLSDMIKIVMQVALAIGIIALVYFIYKGIDDPIQNDKEKDRRYQVVIQKLKDIRTAQVAYKSVKGRFTTSFDTLISFVKSDSIPIVKQEGSVPEEFIEELKSYKDAELKAIKEGLIKRDTIRVSTLDSLFRKGYPIDDLKLVPFSNNIQFEMGAKAIETASKVKVQVFEAKVPNHIILTGMENQYIINLNEQAKSLNRYPGLKVGSLEEATNNAGNWE